MSHIQTSSASPPQMTQHAMLVIWKLFARRTGLGKLIEAVEMQQKKRDHTPQTKVLEFLVAVLADLPYLQDISRSAHPLDQDRVVAVGTASAVRMVAALVPTSTNTNATANDKSLARRLYPTLADLGCLNIASDLIVIFWLPVRLTRTGKCSKVGMCSRFSIGVFFPQASTPHPVLKHAHCYELSGL